MYREIVDNKGRYNTYNYILKSIRNRRKLSHNEEIQLVLLAQSGNIRARDRLIESLLLFVIGLSKYFIKLGTPKTDIIQEGVFGLVEAIENHDVSAGWRLISFAAPKVRSKMQILVAKNKPRWKAPIKHSQVIYNIFKVRDKLYQEKEREPTVDELSEATGFPAVNIQEAIMSNTDTESIDHPIYLDGPKLYEVLDSGIEPTDCEAERNNEYDILNDLLLVLDERELFIIKLMYGVGMGGGKVQTHEITEYFNHTNGNTHLIKNKALKKMKANLFLQSKAV